jgi:hypothetical protein
VGPQDPSDAAQAIARDLIGTVGKLATLQAEDAAQWLTGPEYEALRLRLEMAHAAAVAAVVEARRRVRLDEEQVGSVARFVAA